VTTLLGTLATTAASVSKPATDDGLTSRTAVEWQRERDKREPLKRDLDAERKSLIRDFVSESLEPARNDLDSVLLSIANDDDIGAAYHFRRLVAAIKHAAQGFKELAA
jgi:hypothetical protein